MVRPKGSKNAVHTKKANVDYSAIVAEKTTAKEQIETEIAALSDNISVLKEQLKSKKTALKVAILGHCGTVGEHLDFPEQLYQAYQRANGLSERTAPNECDAFSLRFPVRQECASRPSGLNSP